jgi:hypothetical protein
MAIESPYVTDAGLQIPTVETLIAEIAAEQRSEVDPLLNTDPDSPQGNINGIFSSHIREAYEVIQICFDGFNPDGAEGALLENVSAITGTLRGTATRSKFAGSRKITVNLDAGKTLPIGSVASQTGNPTVRFATTEEVTNTSLIAADVLVAAECDVTGPTVCNASTLTVIATPVSGWNSVNNIYDAEIGKVQDIDPTLRSQREEELRATGSGTVDSITADVLAITIDGAKPVETCLVLENVTDLYDAWGLPPHSLEAIIYDGLSASVPDDTIAQTLWDSKGGGIRMVGSSSGQALDGTGTIRTVSFTRPSQVRMKIAFSIIPKPDYAEVYPGDAYTKQLIVDEFKSIVKAGAMIVCNNYVSVVMDLPGVLDVIVFRINAWALAGYPAVLTNYQLLEREIGTLAVADIAIS